jgi:hypothetical protein
MNAIKSLCVALALSAVAAPALADQTLAFGPVIGLTVNQNSADLYSSHRGKLIILDSQLQMREFYWGGQSCNGRNLTEADLQILARAVGNRSLYVAPSSKNGAGGRKCLVGYILAEPDAIEVMQQ